MFEIDTDKTIHLTRGDYAQIEYRVKDKQTGSDYVFKMGDQIAFTVCKKGDCGTVLLQKHFGTSGNTTVVDIVLTSEDTAFGEVINKPREYWYEVELNPGTSSQTTIGYDKDGPKKLMLYPEGCVEYEY